MSSSVFAESSIASSEPLLNGDSSAPKADSNLVVVYGKNGINVDRKGLENLIDEKTLTSISVIRITSPTPSMKEEEAEEIRKEDEENAEKCETSSGSADEVEEKDGSDSEDDINAPKAPKTPAKPRPEILGLTVEEFYPPEAAKELVKEILKYAGVTPLKCDVDYDFQRYVIKNDHCYTPYTSPSQLIKEKPSSSEGGKPDATIIRRPLTSSATVKQYLNKRKQLNDEKQRKLQEKDRTVSNSADNDESTADDQRADEDRDDDGDEEEEDESDYSEESEESAESDNDRDSDLDFDVNNRHGRKKKATGRRRKKKEKQRARSVLMQRPASKRRPHSQDNSYDEEKSLPSTVKPSKQQLEGRKLISTKAIARKQMPDATDIASPVSTYLPPPPPPPTATIQPKPLINIQSVEVISAPSCSPVQPKAIAESHPVQMKPVQPKIVVQQVVQPPSQQTTLQSSLQQSLQSPVQHTIQRPIQSPVQAPAQPNPVVTQSPQTVKQIVISKVTASPKGGFTDLNTLLSRPENVQSNLRVAELKPEKPATTPMPKGFMPLGIESASKNQLPAQISIQTHQSSSELAAENDKQMELINSIFNDELEKSFKTAEKPPMKENSIPDLVKMLESTEKAVLEKNKLAPTFTSTSSVEAIDIANAPLLETPDDEIPDELLQHVVELMEDKSLQEAVEKEVYQQQLKQQKQNITLQPHQPHTSQAPQQAILSQPVRNVQVTSVAKPPKSIIEASISNATTPNSSRDTTPTPSSNKPHSVSAIRKEPIQIVRGNGRVITLPPIEAPTTRAKRRAQVQPNTDTSFVDSEGGDVSMHSDTSAFGETSVAEKFDTPVSAPAKSRNSSAKATGVGRKKAAAKAPKHVVAKAEEEEESQDDEDDDDPNKLWCICRQPHNNRFMICCDVCEDWFHGTCVSITKAMGLEMEQKGIEWTCPKCVKKAEAKKQRKITDLFDKKTIVQLMPRLDDPAKLSATSIQSTITVTELQADRKSTTIDLKKLPTGQFYPLTPRMDNARKQQQALSASMATSAPATPTAAPITSQSGPRPATSTPNAAGVATKRPLTTTPKQMGRGLTVLKTTPVQQHIKTTKVATAAEKKQFIISKSPEATVQQSKSLAHSTSFDSGMPAANNAHHQTKASLHKQASVELLTCIVCKKPARANSIYCSDDCIRKHAQNALINVSKNAVKPIEPVASPASAKLGPDDKKKKSKGLFEDLLSMADRKPKVERVYVFERRSGRILTGNNAPTTANLKKWLQDNPTFEVVQPGSAQALEIEKSKQKARFNVQPPSSSTVFTTIKTDSIVTTTVTPLTSPTIISSSPAFPKTNKVQDINKSITRTTTIPVTQPQQRTLLPKTPQPQPKTPQPQPVSTKSDRNDKEKDKTTPVSPHQTPLKSEKIDKDKDKPSSSTPHKAVKKQISVEKEPSASQTPTRSDSSEPIRENVRRTLKEQLMVRMNEISEDKRLTVEQVESFVKATEQEMFRLFNKDIGSKYKAKYRSLMFNIKDRKNETLFQKICFKLIEPRQLVRMSPEEMASQELAQWREKEAKHQLEMIKKSELDMLSCAKNYVLKTHKGEEVIEGKATDRVELDISIPVEDVVAVLNNSTVSSTTEIEASPAPVTPRKDNPFEMDKSASGTQDMIPTTPSSSSDKRNTFSREKDREREKRHKSKDRHREKTRKRSRSRSRERHHKSSSRKDERRDKDDRISKKEEHETRISKDDTLRVTVPPTTTTLTSNKPLISPKPHKDRDLATKKSTKTPVENFSLVDKIIESTKTVEQAANLLNDKEPSAVAATPTTPAPSSTNKPQSPSALDSDQEPSSTVSISTPPEDPYFKYSTDVDASIWTGNINMIDVASFQVSIQTVSGNTYLLSKDLPDELDVVGRISPETVWDYIGKIKRSPNKEIVIIRLVPSVESENVAYTILYKYLDKRKRLGVIKTTSPNIKDFYIMPLGVGQQMPFILQPSENIEFYDDVMRPDMLLGIVIRIMGKRHANPATKIQRKKEVTVITNRIASAGLENDGVASFTPPGSPKQRSDANRSGSGVNRLRMQPPKSTDDEEIDVDAIIKAPIASKNISKGQVAASSTTVTSKRDDADEPYSPGGSSDDDVHTDDDLKRKMDEINRKIEAQKMEIAGLLKNDPSSFNASSGTLAPALANISIPSNLHQILASIQSKPESQSAITKPPSMVPPPPIIGSLSRGDEEYAVETKVSHSARALNSRSEAKQTSRLAQLSEAELLSMVPDNIDLDNTASSSTSHTNSDAPPEKRSRWSEPPPPGLESEY